jgi:FkbM family methyltransferase
VTTLRHRVIRIARELGVEDRLRDVHALRSRDARRDRRDMHALRRLMALTLAEDASCVDVGANVGVVLRDIVRFAPHGRHVAYEPLPDLAAQLTTEFPAVDVRNAAVSDHVGEATFHRVRDRDTRSSLSALDFSDDQLERFTVRLEALDESLPEGFLPTLVKIDVEGAEEQVLRGAERLLAEHRPTIVLEHNAGARHFGTSSATIHGLLTTAGLRVFDIDGRGPYDAPSFERLVARGRMWTFVAHR